MYNFARTNPIKHHEESKLQQSQQARNDQVNISHAYLTHLTRPAKCVWYLYSYRLMSIHQISPFSTGLLIRSSLSRYHSRGSQNLSFIVYSHVNAITVLLIKHEETALMNDHYLCYRSRVPWLTCQKKSIEYAWISRYSITRHRDRTADGGQDIWRYIVHQLF